jgi:hypothetical protein
MSPLLLLEAVMFVVVVVAAWFSPKRYRPWCRAALLVGATGFAPKGSVFMWLVWTTPFVVTAALVLTFRKPASYRE